MQTCKLLCEHLDKDGVKDVESAVGAVRSDKVKKEREQAAKDKKGALLLASTRSTSVVVVHVLVRRGCFTSFLLLLCGSHVYCRLFLGPAVEHSSNCSTTSVMCIK